MPCSVEMTCSFRSFRVALLQILNGCGVTPLHAELCGGLFLCCDGSFVEVRKRVLVVNRVGNVEEMCEQAEDAEI